MSNTINFSVVSLIMVRLRGYTRESFVDECFKRQSERNRQHLVNKIPADGDLFVKVMQSLHTFDLPHIREITRFLNNLVPDHERSDYDKYS